MLYTANLPSPDPADTRPSPLGMRRNSHERSDGCSTGDPFLKATKSPPNRHRDQVAAVDHFTRARAVLEEDVVHAGPRVLPRQAARGPAEVFLALRVVEPVEAERTDRAPIDRPLRGLARDNAVIPHDRLSRGGTRENDGQEPARER